MKPEILVRVALPALYMEQIVPHFVIHNVSAQGGLEALSIAIRGGIRAVVTTGPVGLTRTDMMSMPRLEIIHALGAGLDRVDVVAAQEREIVVTCGSGANAASVADHALGLLLALLRNIPAADAGIRAGRWPATERPLLTGKHVGVLGLGAIGTAIAKRITGFEATIAYHSRRERLDVEYRYCASPLELVEACDVLMVALPGGEGTQHLVNREVLSVLGPNGYLINVGRGSAVDTVALAAALKNGAIAGAAVDVFEGEPNLPGVLRSAPNLILTPHMAGLSAEALHAARQRAVDNLLCHFAGKHVAGLVNF